MNHEFTIGCTEGDRWNVQGGRVYEFNSGPTPFTEYRLTGIRMRFSPDTAPVQPGMLALRAVHAPGTPNLLLTDTGIDAACNIGEFVPLRFNPKIVFPAQVLVEIYKANNTPPGVRIDAIELRAETCDDPRAPDMAEPREAPSKTNDPAPVVIPAELYPVPLPPTWAAIEAIERLGMTTIGMCASHTHPVTAPGRAYLAILLARCQLRDVLDGTDALTARTRPETP